MTNHHISAAPAPEGGGAKGRTFKDQRAQKAYDLFLREGWMRGDIERFYRSGFAGVARPDETNTPRIAVWLAGRDRAEAGLPHGIPDRPEFRNLIAALATRDPACKKCSGKGYTEYEGGEGEGYPSRPEIEACSCREEAPAEAGEDGLLRRLDGIARGDIFSDEFVSIHTTCREAAERIRAQPPAREDAQPVGLDVLEGWEDPKTPSVPGPVAWRCRNIGGVWSYGEAKQPNVAFCEPLYDHPAPDALRVAVAKLEKAKITDDPAEVFMLAMEALAALQAEQGAK